MLTQVLVKKLFYYDPISGAFIRIRGWYLFQGTEVQIGDKKYPIASVIWLHYYGKWPETIIDHKNQCRTDTSINNLRKATIQQNAYNQHRPNPTGFKGIYNSGRKSKPWQAQIRINGQKVNLGRFVTQEEAAEAYRQAATTHHGEFACLD